MTRLKDEEAVVLHDPAALEVIHAVERHNCRNTFLANLDRIPYFVQRITDRGLTAKDVVIVIINVDDPHGSLLADALMPGTNWLAMRDRGEMPIARGLAVREGIEEAIATFDSVTSDRIKASPDATCIVVVDRGVAAMFTPDDIPQDVIVFAPAGAKEPR